MAKNIAAWLILTAAFISVNVAVAAALLGAFDLGQWLAPDLMTVPLVTYLLALVVVAVIVWDWMVTVGIIARWLSRSRGRARE